MRGRKVIVTGASRGIGRGIALACAAEGAALAITYVQRKDAAEQVVQAAVEAGGEAFAIQADVALAGDCEQVVRAAMERWGQVDVLVNNAGMIDPIAPGSVAEEAFSHTVDVNLKGSWLMCRVAAPALAAAAGSIVNISSIAGISGYPYGAHYAAAKAGVIALTRSLALELAPRVRVNAVAPGYTNTGDLGGWSEERMRDLAATIPLQRFARPEDVAKAVIFLAMDAPYVTGATLVVDGGLTLRLPGFVTGL